MQFSLKLSMQEKEHNTFMVPDMQKNSSGQYRWDCLPKVKYDWS